MGYRPLDSNGRKWGKLVGISLYHFDVPGLEWTQYFRSAADDSVLIWGSTLCDSDPAPTRESVRDFLVVTETFGAKTDWAVCRQTPFDFSTEWQIDL